MIADLKPYAEYKDSGLPWLGQVPGHWEVKRLKNWVYINKNILPENTQPDYTFNYIDIGAVTTGRLVRRPVQLRFKDSPSRARRLLSPGDTIVSTVRTYLKAVITVDQYQRPIVASTGFAVLSPRGDTVPRCLGYVAESDPFTNQVTADSVGIAYPAISETRLANIAITLPPPAEQAAIVRFLDWASGRLERAIRAKRKVIALLNEQKQAIIHRAVTRGLDPSVPLKPSGIPWLGEIPAHWEVRRIGLFANVGNGSTPSRGQSNYWRGGNYPWLNSAQINRGYIDSADQFVTPKALRECHLPKVPPFSVLIAITGQGKTRGMSAVLGIEATINQHIAYIVPKMSIALPNFIHLALTAAYKQLRAISNDSGSTKGALTCENLKSFQIPLPPIKEQDHLLRRISSETLELTNVMFNLEREIDLLREYRTRLVADVVTGKLDVREAAARLPDEEPPDFTAGDEATADEDLIEEDGE
jgi:type I restriction enzyme S subunit